MWQSGTSYDINDSDKDHFPLMAPELLISGTEKESNEYEFS